MNKATRKENLSPEDPRWMITNDRMKQADGLSRHYSHRWWLARCAQPARVQGGVGAGWAPGGRPHVVFGFTLRAGKIVAIAIVADGALLDQLELRVVNDERAPPLARRRWPSSTR